jgi:hypothetical protein
MYVNTLGNSKASHVGDYLLDENCTHKSNLPYPLEYNSCTVRVSQYTLTLTVQEECYKPASLKYCVSEYMKVRGFCDTLKINIVYIIYIIYEPQFATIVTL